MDAVEKSLVCAALADLVQYILDGKLDSRAHWLRQFEHKHSKLLTETINNQTKPAAVVGFVKTR